MVAPFLADTLGNVFGFYRDLHGTDDVLHFLNWVFLIGGVTLALRRTPVTRLNAWALGYGIGGLAIIWWETAEFLVQEAGTAGLQLTYGDTIGDLLLSSSGRGRRVAGGEVRRAARPDPGPGSGLGPTATGAVRRRRWRRGW